MNSLFLLSILLLILAWKYFFKSSNPQLHQKIKELSAYELALQKHAIISKANPRGVITYVNEALQNISGYSESELLGKDHRILNSGQHSKDFFKTMWRDLRGGKVWRGTICNRAKDGRNYWVDTTITPIRDEDGHILEYLSIRFDITNQIQQYEKDLQGEKLSALGTMVSGVAHEINNPLMVLDFNISMMEKDLAKNNIEKLSDRISKIKKSTNRIARIVAGVQRYSRRSTVRSMSVGQLSDLVAEVVPLIEAQAKAHGVSVRASLECQEAIICDVSEVEQILVNLLINAIDAVKSLDEKWVELCLKRDGDFAVLQVRDSGTGIPPEIRRKLFDPFFTTKPAGSGTGLGLSIVRGLVEANAGSICVVDATHTCFEVRFPLAKPA